MINSINFRSCLEFGGRPRWNFSFSLMVRFLRLYIDSVFIVQHRFALGRGCSTEAASDIQSRLLVVSRQTLGAHAVDAGWHRPRNKIENMLNTMGSFYIDPFLFTSIVVGKPLNGSKKSIFS
jgi:hypothetical protein